MQKEDCDLSVIIVAALKNLFALQKLDDCCEQSYICAGEYLHKNSNFDPVVAERELQVVDEMTDICTDKSLAKFVSFWDEELQNTFYYLWDMILLHPKVEMRTVVTAEHLFNLIRNCFES